VELTKRISHQTSFEIQIRPRQRQQLTPAAAGTRGRDDEWIEPSTFCRLEDGGHSAGVRYA
jgi:hypothetical protein